MPAGPHVAHHGVESGGSGSFAHVQAPAGFHAIQPILPGAHNVLRIVKAQGIALGREIVHAVGTQQETNRVLSAERILRAAGLLIHLRGQLGKFLIGVFHGHFQARLIQHILAIHRHIGVGAAGKRVVDAVHLAADQHGFIYVAHIDDAGLIIRTKVGQHAAGGILVEVLIVHLHHVRQQVARRLRGQLAPIAIPGSELGLDGDVGILFLKLFNSGHGQVMPGLRTPPVHAQRDGFFALRESGRAGAQQRQHQH